MVQRVPQQRAQRRHAQPAGRQQQVVARDLLHRVAVAVGPAHAHHVVGPQAVERVGDPARAPHAQLQHFRARGRGGNGDRHLARPRHAQHDELAGLVAEAVRQVVFEEAQREQVVVLHHLVYAHDARHVRLVGIVAQNGMVGCDFIG